MNKPSGSFIAWENTLCNALDHPRIQSQNAWEDGYASGVAAEREACAKVCDELEYYEDDGSILSGEYWANAIRARGQE